MGVLDRQHQAHPAGMLVLKRGPLHVCRSDRRLKIWHAALNLSVDDLRRTEEHDVRCAAVWITDRQL